MKQVFARSGFRVGRRWLLLGAGGVVVALLYLFVPRGPSGPLLELVALNPDGRYHPRLRVPRVWMDTTGLASGAVVRVPLVLGVRNVGGTAAQPTRLELSVPARYRLARKDGRPLHGHLSQGSPLVRYELAIPFPPVEPSGRTLSLPVLDTVWLEPIVPSFYCVALADSVPEFVPAPPAPVEAIARVQIFYSFSGEDMEERQTGLLGVELDPAMLEQEIPEAPPVFPAQYREPAAPRPELGALRYIGSRQAFCGEPEAPIELLSTLWETPSGGRFFVLDHGGAPRKYLFDMDRDGIIEREMWDPDGDGDFEATREARIPIPPFLMPPPPPPVYDATVLDTLPDDVLLGLDRYRRALAGPYTYRSVPPDTAPRVDRYRPMTIGEEGDDDRDRVPGVTRRYWRPPAPDQDQGAAPRQEPRRNRIAPPQTRRPVPQRSAAPPQERGDERVRGREEVREGGAVERTTGERSVERERRRRREPKLLGTPVDSLPNRRPRP